MFRKLIVPIALVAGLALGPAYAADQQAAAQPQAQTSTAIPNIFDPSTWTSGVPGTGAPAYNTGTAGGYNWFDPSTWMNMGGVPGMGMGGPVQFNLAHPAGWSVFMNPATYASMMNPATYGQFMTPQFYMQFLNPNNWLSWLNPAAYGPWLNPATYLQPLNPAAYMPYLNPMTYLNWLNPGNYMAFINPATYLQWLNPAAYTIPSTTPGGVGFNIFDPSTWTSATPGQPAQ